MQTFTIVPVGAFSLRELAEFGFGQRHSERFEGVMRLAFVLDGYETQVGVEVRQDDAGIHGIVTGTDDVGAVQRQVARFLSLDHDGRAFDDLKQRDHVIGRLLGVAPGLRPPLFHSPYEAALWAVLSARRPAKQMAEVREQLSRQHGATFRLADQDRSAVPTPRQLLRVEQLPGLPPEKIARLHGVARAAIEGQLDAERLLSLGPAAAVADVQSIKGIGPFYASLIVIRGTGFADVLPREEPILLGLVTSLYDLPHECTADELDEIAESWKPFRTWAAVLVRAASARLT